MRIRKRSIATATVKHPAIRTIDCVRCNLHTLVCMSRVVRQEPWSWLIYPAMLFPLLDFPLSLGVDTAVFPADVILDPEVEPLAIGEARCDLIGM